MGSLLVGRACFDPTVAPQLFDILAKAEARALHNYQLEQAQARRAQLLQDYPERQQRVKKLMST